MIFINKGKAPPALITYRQTPYASYDSNTASEAKKAIRKSLIVEQGYLCAYCMRRINNIDELTIEHIIPQHPQEGASNEDEKLNYKNMLGVCNGNQPSANNRCKAEDLTCDKHRGNAPLTVNPLNNSTLSSIEYSRKGVIFSNDGVINYNLNTTLNLNCESSHLVENRKAVYEGLVSVLNHKGKTPEVLRKIRSRYTVLDEEGKRIPYAGVALFFIKKWERKIGIIT